MVHKNYVIVTFYECPSASSRSDPQQYTRPPSGTQRGRRRGGDRSDGGVLPRVSGDVLLWFPVSRLWEGAGALKAAGNFTHSKRQNWIDRSLKSPQERGGGWGGEGGGVHSLIPVGWRRAATTAASSSEFPPAPATFSHGFSNSSLSPEFERSTLEWSLFVPVVFVKVPPH